METCPCVMSARESLSERRRDPPWPLCNPPPHAPVYGIRPTHGGAVGAVGALGAKGTERAKVAGVQEGARDEGVDEV